MIDELNDIPALVPKLLVQLASLGSITQAATALNVSQPAASKAIRNAELRLGVALIRRDNRPLELTQEGQLIAEYAKQQQEKEDALIQQLRQIKKEGAGTIKIFCLILFKKLAKTFLTLRLKFMSIRTKVLYQP